MSPPATSNRSARDRLRKAWNRTTRSLEHDPMTLHEFNCFFRTHVVMRGQLPDLHRTFRTNHDSRRALFGEWRGKFATPRCLLVTSECTETSRSTPWANGLLGREGRCCRV